MSDLTRRVFADYDVTIACGSSPSEIEEALERNNDAALDLAHQIEALEAYADRLDRAVETMRECGLNGHVYAEFAANIRRTLRHAEKETTT